MLLEVEMHLLSINGRENEAFSELKVISEKEN